MKSRINILGVGFDNITMEKATNKILGFLEEDGCKTVYTANPEIVMNALDDTEFNRVINHGDLVVADGIGVVIGSRIIDQPLPERVAGYDLVQNLFSKIKHTDKTVYFLGAAPGIAGEASKLMGKKHTGLKIIGTRNGYFNNEEEKEIIDEINRLKPDLLLVGLGMVTQENFANRYKDQLEVKACICVGGSFDGMAGVVKRAPDIFIKLNLEWFYRLLKQPKRFFRMLSLPKFLIKVIFEGKKYSKEDK